MKLAIAAIAISLTSLGVSAFVAFRDRGRLYAECRVYKHEDTNEYSHLYIKAVNAGRRPITLLWLMGRYAGNELGGTLVENGGLKLAEGDFYEERIGKYDGMMISTRDLDDKICNLKELYLEDTSGKKYTIKNSKKCIAKLWSSKHSLGIRTHHSN